MSSRITLRQLSGLAAALLLAAGSFYLGSILNGFSINLCYNEILIQITNDVEQATLQKDPAMLQTLGDNLRALPLLGYESDCQDILAALRARTDN